MKGSKKLISIYDYILQELAVLAKENGVSISDLASIILSYSIRLLRGKTNIEETLKHSLLLSDARRLGAILIPLSAIEAVFKEPSNVDLVVSDISKFLKNLIAYIKAYEIEDITVKDVLTLFIPALSIDEINTEKASKIIISIIPIFSKNKNIVEYISKVASTVLEEWGYQVLQINIHESIIIVEFVRAEQKR